MYKDSSLSNLEKFYLQQIDIDYLNNSFDINSLIKESEINDDINIVNIDMINFLNTDIQEEVKNDKKNDKFISKKKGGKKSSNDIKVKAQKHFLNFIVDFFNDIIEKYYGFKNYFLKFDISQKSNVNDEYIENLKQLTIEQIFTKFDVSNQYKKNIDNYNINLKLSLIKQNDSINKLLNMNYIDLFIIYYNENKPLKQYLINDKIIILTKTKSFYYLIQKNKKYEEDLKRLIKIDYLDKILLND